MKTNADVEALMRLVGGHPYLVRHALYLVSSGKATVQELMRVGAEDQGPFGDHLRSRLWSLRHAERLRAAIREVILHGMCRNEREFQALSSGGLVRGPSRDRAEMRCALYRQYFQKHL